MKPSLLLISGWAFPASAWAPVVRRLESNWRVRVIGAGDVLADWTPDQGPAVRAERIRSHLPSPGPCFLGGWSLGGMLVLEAARRLGDKLSGILLISSTPRFCRDKTQDWGVPPAALRAMTSGLRTDPARTLQQFYASSASPGAPDSGRISRWTDEGLDHLDGLHAGLRYLRQTDLRPQLSCGGLPSVLIHGCRDAVVPPHASRALGARIRPSRTEFTPRAGHDLPLRQPEVVARNLQALAGMCA